MSEYTLEYLVFQSVSRGIEGIDVGTEVGAGDGVQDGVEDGTWDGLKVGCAEIP